MPIERFVLCTLNTFTKYTESNLMQVKMTIKDIKIKLFMPKYWKLFKIKCQLIGLYLYKIHFIQFDTSKITWIYQNEIVYEKNIENCRLFRQNFHLPVCICFRLSINSKYTEFNLKQVRITKTNLSLGSMTLAEAWARDRARIKNTFIFESFPQFWFFTRIARIYISVYIDIWTVAVSKQCLINMFYICQAFI